MAQWIEVRARYDKMMENGSVKKVTEPYLADALSCTEAEARGTHALYQRRLPHFIGSHYQNLGNLLGCVRRPLL